MEPLGARKKMGAMGHFPSTSALSEHLMECCHSKIRLTGNGGGAEGGAEGGGGGRTMEIDG